MKQSKLVREINTIINNSELNILNKFQLLDEIKLDGRPDKQDAETLIHEYKQRIAIKRKSVRIPTDIRRDVLQRPTYADGLERTYTGRVEKKKLEGLCRFLTGTDHVYAVNNEDVIRDLHDKLSIVINGNYDSYTVLSVIRNNRLELKARKIAESFISNRDEIKRLTGISFLPNFVPLLDFQSKGEDSTGHNYTRIGDYYIKTSIKIEEDSDYYSKSWHSRYGSKKTKSDRTIHVLKNGKEVHTIGLKSFGGNWLINSLVKVLKIKKVKVHSSLRKVQLNDYFCVDKIEQKLNVSIYKRTLSGEFIDYCIVKGNDTFHADSIAECFSGLKRKIKERRMFDGQIITAADAYDLGFCQAGVQSFCNDNNLDINGTYARKELRNIVTAKRTLNCNKYEEELKQLGINLNCK